MRCSVLAGLILSVVIAGCAGSGKQVVRQINVDDLPAVRGSPHPLSDWLFGVGSTLRPFCASDAGRPEDRRRLTELCAPPFGPPQYSLSLSGGGFRATLFHYGAIKRINDGGQLRNLRLLCGVSGGALTGAALISQWDKLRFNEHGVATNLDDLVGKELLKLSSRTIDTPTVIRNFLTFGHLGSTIAPTLEKSPLFRGRTLASLPNESDQPLLVLLATDIKQGRQYVVSRDYAGSFSDDLYMHNMTIAQAVAASASFPAVLGPIRFILSSNDDRRELYLVDGGVIDNLGLSHCDRSKLHFVSDASNPMDSVFEDRSWISTANRSIDIVHSLSSQRYMRNSPETHGSMHWSLAGTHEWEGLTREQISDAQIPTRFKALAAATQCALINAGYVSSHMTLRNRADLDLRVGGLPCVVKDDDDK